jgi:hypothetical protein
MLMVGEPVWMMAPKRERMAVFIWSLISVSTFCGQFMHLAFSYFHGETVFGTYSNMVSLYILVLRGADVIPSAYTLLYEGMGQNRYSLFNPEYGNWDDVIVTQEHALPED